MKSHKIQRRLWLGGTVSGGIFGKDFPVSRKIVLSLLPEPCYNGSYESILRKDAVSFGDV